MTTEMYYDVLSLTYLMFLPVFMTGIYIIYHDKK